jgi:SAM-dependent methyltransferase
LKSPLKHRLSLHRLQRKFRRRFASRSTRRHELAGPSEVWYEKRAFQIKFLKEHGLQPSDTVVDIGCGTLRGGVPLIDYLDAGNYTGVDVRSEIEPEARAELTEHQLDAKAPSLVFGNRLADTHLERHFDIAWAFSLLFHLTDEHLTECFAFVREHLATTGVFYANVNLGENAPGHWSGFPELWRTLDEYEERARGVGVRAMDLGTLEALGDRSSIGLTQNMLEFRPCTGARPR